MSSRWLRVLAVLMAFGLIAAACGNDDGDGGATGPTTTTSTTAGDGSDDDDGMPDDMDPNGVLRLGAPLTGPGVGEFDIIEQVVHLSTIEEWLYGTLLRMTPSGEVVPDLAESAEIVDPSTVRVTLRPDLVFSDGTPLDAEALKFSWERTLAAENTGVVAEFRQVEEFVIDGPLTVTVNLSQPIAGGWMRILARADTSPVSPTAVQGGVDFSSSPVTAGPYMVEAFETATRQVFVKNPLYWDADNILIPRIEWIPVTADALVNAVRSDAVDRVQLTAAQARELTGVPNWEVMNRTDHAMMLIGHICKNRPPFDDIRVRQAVNYAIDRDALNQGMYDGEGAPMWGFHPEGHPLHNPAVKDYYAHDVDKARELLADAGYTDSNPLTFESLFSPGDGQRGLEILEQQWAQAGIQVTLRQMSSTADFFPDAAVAPMNFFPLALTGTEKVTRVLMPGSYGNVCGWDDPELNEIVLELQGIDQDSPRGVELWQAASLNAIENAVHIFGLFGVRSVAHNTERLGNVEYADDRYGTPVISLHGLYVKK